MLVYDCSAHYSIEVRLLISHMNKQEQITKLKQEGFRAIEERNPEKLLEIVKEIKRISKL